MYRLKTITLYLSLTPIIIEKHIILHGLDDGVRKTNHIKKPFVLDTSTI